MKSRFILKTFLAIIICIGIFTNCSFCKENDGHKWTIKQFTPKPDKFPKCVGEQITRGDFTIVTSPSGHEGECIVDYPGGTNSVGTFQATCTPPSEHGESKEVDYEVGTGKKDAYIEDPVQVKFTAVDEPELVANEPGTYGIRKVFRQNWIAGEKKVVTFDFPERKRTAWSSCGGDIKQGRSTGHSTSGTFSAMWALAIGQGTVTSSYTWNTESSVIYGSPVVNNRKIMISTHDQKVTIKIAYKNTHTRRGEKFVRYNPPLFSPVPQIRWNAWGGIEENVSGDEEANGSGTPNLVRHIACCN